MVPNVLVQFINVPFQITLINLYRHTPLIAFVLSNLKRYINDSREDVCEEERRCIYDILSSIMKNSPVLFTIWSFTEILSVYW